MHECNEAIFKAYIKMLHLNLLYCMKNEYKLGELYILHKALHNANGYNSYWKYLINAAYVVN